MVQLKVWVAEACNRHSSGLGLVLSSFASKDFIQQHELSMLSGYAVREPEMAISCPVLTWVQCALLNFKRSHIPILAITKWLPACAVHHEKGAQSREY